MAHGFSPLRTKPDNVAILVVVGDTATVRIQVLSGAVFEDQQQILQLRRVDG